MLLHELDMQECPQRPVKTGRGILCDSTQSVACFQAIVLLSDVLQNLNFLLVFLFLLGTQQHGINSAARFVIKRSRFAIVRLAASNNVSRFIGSGRISNEEYLRASSELVGRAIGDLVVGRDEEHRAATE